MKENILLFFKYKISLTKAFGLAQDQQDFRERGRTAPNHCTGWHLAIGHEQFTRAAPVQIDGKLNRTVKLSTRQFTIGNARVA